MLMKGNVTMGVHFNPYNTLFTRAVNSEIYVDKSLLIEYTNNAFNRLNRYICVSRPRRFGKSMAANMLVAYYSKGCDSRELFDKLKISRSESYEKYLNKFNVIHLDIQRFLGMEKDIDKMLELFQKRVLREVEIEYPEIPIYDNNLAMALEDIFAATHEQFVFIIDEWDCVFRNNSKPAIVVELKVNTSVETAMNQIRDKDYAKSLKGYRGKVVMVGIAYDKATKEHSCLIEEVNR